MTDEGEKKHAVYVYGTLRPGGDDTVLIPGVIYDLGWFPGARVDFERHGDGPSFVAERVEVSDYKLKEFDAYEGYDPDRPHASLYIRKPYLDGWIYEYNGNVKTTDVISSGDWLKYTGQNRGFAA